MKNIHKWAICALIVLLSVSCSNVQSLLKGNDYEAMYVAAERYYNDKDYSDAIQLFEKLMIQYHGKEHAEDIAWYYAMSLMAEKDYFTAGYQFKQFHKRYPYSSRAEEALYQSANCKYKESPDYYLDQTQTKEAIQEYESYLDRYPQSVHIPEINQHLDELRTKLMHKEYDIAYNYYLTEHYNAAYVSLQAFLNNYPDSPYKEEAMFYMLASGYEYGINSTPEKQKERLQMVINDFDRFSTSFRDSKHIAEAQRFYTRARAALTNLETVVK